MTRKEKATFDALKAAAARDDMAGFVRICEERKPSETLVQVAGSQGRALAAFVAFHGMGRIDNLH